MKKIEPFKIEKIKGSHVYFKVLPDWRLTPSKTLWLNLLKSERQLFSEIAKRTRNSIKKALKNNLQMEIISGNKITKRELREFYDAWSKNKPYNFLFKPSFNELKSLIAAFGKKCFFGFGFSSSTNEEKLVAACLVLSSKNMAFDWFGMTTPLGRRLSVKPLVLWEAIKEAKRQKLRVFDFEGVWDERFPRHNKGWKGFTKFKEGFSKI